MATRKQHKVTDLPKPQIGKDEMNLCELPIAKLGKRDTRDVIEFTGEVVKDGKIITQKWVVRGAGGLGLPTEFAERVLVALISLAAAQGFPQKTTFIVYEVLKLMGLSDAGSHYKEFTLALQRLKGVMITNDSAWWDHQKKKYSTISEGFGLIDRFRVKVITDEERKTGSGFVVWNEWLLESFRAGYIKNLDTQFYYALENTLARRLYRFLDKRMHYQDSYQIDIFALAARLGMAEYHYPSKVIEKLQPAFDELIARNYLCCAEVIKVKQFTRIKFTKAGTVISMPKGLPFVPADANTPQTPEVDAASESSIAALYASYETPDHLKEAWASILQELKQTMLSASYVTIEESGLLAVRDNTALIAIPLLMKEWAERQLRRKILSALSGILKTKITSLEFVTLP